jgi:hypothetical protein
VDDGGYFLIEIGDDENLIFDDRIIFFIRLYELDLIGVGLGRELWEIGLI